MADRPSVVADFMTFMSLFALITLVNLTHCILATS